MNTYKCSDSRLARFFKDSRDKWKARAEKNQKRVRTLQTKVRDLTKSRGYWKNRTRQAEEDERSTEEKYSYLLSQAQQKIKGGDVNSIEQENKPVPPTDEGAKEGKLSVYKSVALVSDGEQLQIPYGHMYPLFVMQLAVEEIINSFSSLRGCQNNLQSLTGIPAPSFTTIRNWILRLGLHEIKKSQEWRTDWVYIVDMTIELGKAKCLLVVGIPKARLPITSSSVRGEQGSYALCHHDVDVLDLEVMTNPTGEMVYQSLEDLSRNIGPPLQIISDHGSDIYKGVRIFLDNHKDTIYTYDITHKMALLLKHELEDDERFQEFMVKSAITRKKVQQTELNFLKPPAQRTKSRYHNIATNVKWAKQMLSYHAKGDFSALGTQCIMDVDTFDVAWNILDYKCLSTKALYQVPWGEYETKGQFIHTITDYLGNILSEQDSERIYQSADKGRRRFDQYFGWVAEYQEDMELYSQFIEIITAAEQQIKDQGLNRESKALFEENMVGNTFAPRAQRLNRSVVDYLSEEGANIPKGDTLLGTSDIVESIIGKYKQLSGRSSIREIGKTILAIPLFTGKILSGLVKKAMESVRGVDVENWANRTFGKSPLARRRSVLGTAKRNKSCRKNVL